MGGSVMEKMYFAMNKANFSKVFGLILLGLMLAVTPPMISGYDMAMAYDAPPKDQGHSGPGGGGPPPPPPPEEDQEEEADPVQLQSGNFKMDAVDAIIYSYALPLNLTRTYNNLDVVYDGPFGRGWSSSFVMSIRETTRYAVGGGGSSGGGSSLAIVLGKDLILRDDTGMRHTWTETDTGGWTNGRTRQGSMVKTGTGNYIWTRSDGVQFRFVNSRLDRIVDLNGNEIVVSYDNSGRITRVVNPAGRGVTYGYNAASKIASMTDDIGRTVSFGYDSDNLLTTVTDQNGNVTTYGYDDAGRLDQITAPDGVVTLTNTYNDSGRITNQTALGASFTFTYNETYTRVRNSRGGYSDHYFNEFGNDVRVRDARGGNRYKTWDDEGNLLSVQDQGGDVTTFTYDDGGNILTTTFPNGGVVTNTYTTNRRVTSMTDPLGNTTTYTYDANGNLETTTNPLGEVTTLTYDSAGRVLTETDETGGVSTWVYNSDGDIESVTNQNGLTTSFTYDAAGRILTRTNADNETTTFAYTPRDRLASVTDPLGQVTAYVYDVNDQLLSTTDPLGQVTARGYDGFGRVATDTTALGFVTAYAYDSLGNLTQVTDAEGRVTTRVYDSGQLLTRVIRPDGSQINYAYDSEGNLTSMTDPRGNTTSYTYDAMDWQVGVTYADGSTISRTFDLEGRLTGYTDRKGQAFSFSYDADDRRTQLALPNDGVVDYGYDARDNITSIAGYIGALNYAYDAGNRIASESGAWGDVIDFAYDNADRLTSLTRPDRYGISYAYDDDGRLTASTSPSGTASFGYDDDDRLVSEILGNGVSVAYSYDDDDRLTSLVYTAPDDVTVLMSNSYVYDDTGLVLSMTELDGTVHSYGYDNLLRLTSETITPGNGDPATATTWSYDNNGNRLTQTRDGVTTTFTYNTVDELTGDDTGVSYSYDANGNLVTAITLAGTETYTYDDRNRMTGMSGDGLITTTYGYNAEGIRVQRNLDGTESREVRWGDVLLEEKDATDVPQQRYDHGLGLTAITGDFGTRHYLFDGISNTRALTDTAGAITDTYGLGANGNDVTQTGSTPNPYVWNGGVGYYNEGQGGQYHVGARFYDADIGRFTQSDPVRQGFNPYRHGMNNPLSYDDPSGEIIPMLAAWCARGAAQAVFEEGLTHGAESLAGIKSERGFGSYAGAAALGCITGGFGNKWRRACRGSICNCSFDGATQVVTDGGLVPISEVDPETMRVMARDEITGELAFREILSHYNSEYLVRVNLTFRNVETGVEQTIVSNAIHPYFAVPGAVERPMLASHDGATYKGDIPGGAWIDASDLRPGDLLQTAAGDWSEVVTVDILDVPLKAWNMTVAETDNYFVTNTSMEDSVWVHNCGTYRVPGNRTRSGKPYVGQTGKDTPGQRPGNGRDGRTREDGDAVTEMPNSTRREREIQEQIEINQNGGVDALDNRQNSVAPSKWEGLGIPPPS